MNRWLAVGYASNVGLIIASILFARGVFTSLDQKASLLLSQGLLVLLLPAGIVTLRGALRSQGTLRRVLGYSLFGLDVFLSLTGLLIGALVYFAGATVVA